MANTKRSTTTPVTYKALSANDQLAMATDVLRSRESDHFRNEIVYDGRDISTVPGAEETQNELAEQIQALQSRVETLRTEVEGTDA